MKREMRCGNCHGRCHLIVSLNDNLLVESVSGNACSHGLVYAKEENDNPLKIFVKLMNIEGGIEEVTCIKTNMPVPKEMIADIEEDVKSLILHAPAEYGDVVIHNIYGTGADVIMARTIYARELLS